ncbi:unnamed protein product [Bursaphelenchus okinawaensis]|uniref:Maelstrom domain-containing protein n=1 Tax=Bursaphelenchus okinawaensis TaxID=465554 RepID=A0A811L4Y8_9BILA|nr:unnamed protein product [Bursaphelenchus okinawaensis]CAG9117327.1 unnamed protein product [Bursaphelenchus okinawaensis]
MTSEHRPYVRRTKPTAKHQMPYRCYENSATVRVKKRPTPNREQTQQRRLQQQRNTYLAALEQQKKLATMLGTRDDEPEARQDNEEALISRLAEEFQQKMLTSGRRIIYNQPNQWTPSSRNNRYEGNHSAEAYFKAREASKAKRLARVREYQRLQNAKMNQAASTHRKPPVTRDGPWYGPNGEILEPRHEEERIFCHSIRYFERQNEDEADSEFVTRDTFGRVFKVRYIGYNNQVAAPVCRRRRKPCNGDEYELQDCQDIDFGDHIIDMSERDTYERRLKYNQDKSKMLKFFHNFINDGTDVTNLRRMRMMIMSMQMYDDIDGLVMPAEVAMAEFSLQNGVIDYFDSLIEPVHRLSTLQKRRLNSTAANGFSLGRSQYERERYRRPPNVLHDMVRRLQTITALFRNEASIPYSNGFLEFARSVFPNLDTDPEAWKNQTPSRNNEAPLLVGEWGNRWILVLDHEYKKVIQGVNEMTNIIDLEHGSLRIDPERFILASAFIDALASFVGMNEDLSSFVNEMNLYGTPEGEESNLHQVTNPLCSFHQAIHNYRCARNAVLGICYTLEQCFRSHFGNEILPDRDFAPKTAGVAYRPPGDHDEFE